MWTISPGRARGAWGGARASGLMTLGLGACGDGGAARTADAGPAVTPAAGPLCVTRDPGPSPLRRLTAAEYARTVHDLFGGDVLDVSRLPPGERALGFDNNADVISTSDLLVDAYEALAEQAGAVVAGNLATYVPCAMSSPDSACAARYRNCGRAIITAVT